MTDTDTEPELTSFERNTAKVVAVIGGTMLIYTVGMLLIAVFSNNTVWAYRGGVTALGALAFMYTAANANAIIRCMR